MAEACSTSLCETPSDPEYRIISFNSRYQLNALPTGNVVFSDTCCLDDADCENINIPIQASINALLESNGNNPTITECYNENPLWINGLIRSYTKNNASGTTSVNVSSYFEYLNSKPIITQQFKGYWLSEVFDTIFRYYAGVPSSLYGTLDFYNTQITGPVQGTNLWQELEALAMAGRSNIFVQVGGKIEIGKWKDNTDPVELVIPEEALISAEPAEYRYPQTTMVNIKGASVSRLECGEQPLSTDDKGNPGNGSKCIISGLKVKTIDLDINNLIGDETDMKSAEITFSNLSTTPNSKEVKNKTISTKARNDNGYFGPEPTNTKYYVAGLNRSKKQEAENNLYRNTKFWENPKGAYNVFTRIAAGKFPVAFSSFGLGAFGSPAFLSGNMKDGNDNPIKTTLQQVETLVVDPTYNINGVSQESIENKYVYNKVRLFNLGIRRLQEIKLAQNTWNVEVIYMPCLKLNQMIEFKVPEVEGCTQKTIKGIISGIDIDHTTESDGVQCTKMKLSVMDVACLNTTDYVSGNLISSHCAGQNSGDLNPWQTSQYNISSTASVNNCGALFAADGGSGHLEFTQKDVSPADSFDFYFEYQQIEGTTPCKFEIFYANTSHLVLLSGSGSYSGSFSAGYDYFQMRWDLINSISATYFKICNIRLTQTKTA